MDHVGMRTIAGSACAAVLFTAFAACGPDAPEPMEGVPGRGGRCSVQMDCFECDGCRLPWTEVCVQETCWLSGEADPADADGDPLFGSVNLEIGLSRDLDAGSVRSAAIRVLHPRRTDGHPLSCDDLLMNAVGSDEDPALNRLRTLEPPTPSLPPGAGVVSLGANRIPTGPDRLFLVRLHPSANGGGDALAVGCSGGVDVAEGSGQSVVVETTVP